MVFPVDYVFCYGEDCDVCVRDWFHPFAPRLEKNPSFPLSGTKDSRNRVTQCWEEANFRPQNVWFRHNLNAPPFVFCLNSTLMSWSSGITYCFTLFNWQTSCHHDMHVCRCLCSALYFLAAMEWGRQGWTTISVQLSQFWYSAPAGQGKLRFFTVLCWPILEMWFWRPFPPSYLLKSWLACILC